MLKVWAVEENDWFRVKNQNLIDLELKYICSVPDKEYFVYEDNQTPEYRNEYLSSLLEIAIGDDGYSYVLNPCVIFPDGEWEAWNYNSEGPIR